MYFKFILSFALILLTARIGGELMQRYAKQPPVLGELIVGMIISPFALGGLLHDPIILNFATVDAFGGEFNIMEVISEIAVIALLFVAGIETDVRSFLKHGLSGSVVAAGGVILPFIFGYFVTFLLYPAGGPAEWLFMGATLTATSIGLTVRILMDMNRLHTVEGTTILVAAVVDDIIGIVILSIVISVSQTGLISFANALWLGFIGFGVWFVLLQMGVRFHKYLSLIFLSPFKKSGTMPIFALLIGYLIAYLVTFAKLHPVVGAYIAGLMFAATDEKEEILEKTRPIMLFLAPFFFAYLGMQVDLSLLLHAIVIAMILVVFAIIGKIVGCYIPAKFYGKLSHYKAMIVGIGMVPRGEVGLIIAGAGFLAGAISRDLFGAAVAVSIITTLVTPAMLKPYLRKVPAENKKRN